MHSCRFGGRTTLNKSDKIASWALVVSIFAIGISIFAALQTKSMYDETTRPHAKWDELKDTLNALDNRIDRVEKWMEGKEENENYTHWFNNLSIADNARNTAWLQLGLHNFSGVEDYYNMAHDSLDQIPTTIEPTSGELPICCLISVIIVVIIIVILFFLDKEKTVNK